MNKKILIITLIAVLTLGLTACNSNSTKSTNSPTDATEVKSKELTELELVAEETSKKASESDDYPELEAISFQGTTLEETTLKIAITEGSTEDDFTRISEYIIQVYASKIKEAKIKMPKTWTIQVTGIAGEQNADGSEIYSKMYTETSEK